MWVKSPVMGSVIGFLNDFLGDCTCEMIWDFFWIEVCYVHGSGGLVMTCLEVKCVFKIFEE